MTYIESIEFLYNLQKFGMKFGLRGIRSLMHSLNNPERQFKSIHIAGTNGKGSTASIIAAIFTAAGYKTGLYTSPHLINFNERIRINGKPIPSHVVARLITRIRSEVEENHNTFFEATTAIAFQYFAESNVDIAIIEAGLGGRLDSTNIIHPLVSIITTIGLEHTKVLGTRIEDIAFEKAGIIKRGVPCVTGVKLKKVVRILQDTCDRKKTRLININPSMINIRCSSLNGIESDFSKYGRYLDSIRISLAGEHQVYNTLLALITINVAAKRSCFKIDQKAIQTGLENIQKYSGLQARLSVIRKNPLVIADVAHNPDAIRTLCKSLKQLNFIKLHIVFGLMQDKNYKQIIGIICNVTHRAFVVEARTERSRNVADLANEFRRKGVYVKKYQSVVDGIKAAFHLQDGVPILITGSHFVVGEALAFLYGKKYLTINQ